MSDFETRSQQIQRWFSRHPYILWIACISFVGIGLAFLVDDYGQSWDDPADTNYGLAVLRAYTGDDAFLDNYDWKYHGTAYFLLIASVSKIATSLNPNLLAVDVRHALNFGTFVVCAIALYFIARKILSGWTSLIAMALFISQPLLFGHAFINQKDIPFMAAFTLSVALGLYAFEDRKNQSDLPGGVEPHKKNFMRWSEIAQNFSALDGKRKLVLICTVILTLLLGILLLEKSIVLTPINQLVNEAYQGIIWSPLQRIFDVVAQDAYKTPVSAYLAKIDVIYSWIRVPLGLIGISAALFIASRVFSSVSPQPLWRWNRKSTLIVLSGIVLGFATAIRIAGPWAGILITLYALILARKRALPHLLGYWITAAVVTFILWPLLWDKPLQNLISSLIRMSSFTPHDVLFNGRLLLSDNLPSEYLLTLINLQLTEPAILLILLGSIFGVSVAIRYASIRTIFFLLILWFILPVVLFVLLNTPIYGNFRQLLFILPPLFVLAGFAYEWGSMKLPGLLYALLVIVSLLPGIVGIIRLHPYEYTYYNSLAGPTEAINGKYELDYWCTSYREAMDFVNSAGSSGDEVLVLGPISNAQTFAREDLELIPDYVGSSDPEFILTCERAIGMNWEELGLDKVYLVERSGAIFGEVYGRRQ
jgi:hypothetical protein